MNELEKLRQLTEVLTSNGYLTDQTKAWKYAFNSVNVFVCISNPDYKIKFINKPLQNLLGVTDPDTLTNEKLSSLANGVLFSVEEEELSLEVNDRVEYDISYIDTFDRWFKKSKSAIRDRNNDLIGYLFIMDDKTQLERTLEEANRANKQLSQAIKRLHFMITAADGYMWEKELCESLDEMIYVYADPIFCKEILGLTPSDLDDPICKEAYRRSITDVLGDFKVDNRKNNFDVISNITDRITVDEGRPCEFIEMGYIEHEAGKSEWVIVRVRKTPLFNDLDECTGIIGFGNNYSAHPQSFKFFIEKGLVTGRLKKIPTGNNESKIYWVMETPRDKDKPLSHVDFP